MTRETKSCKHDKYTWRCILFILQGFRDILIIISLMPFVEALMTGCFRRGAGVEVHAAFPFEVSPESEVLEKVHDAVYVLYSSPSWPVKSDLATSNPRKSHVVTNPLSLSWSLVSKITVEEGVGGSESQRIHRCYKLKTEIYLENVVEDAAAGGTNPWRSGK